MASVSYRINGQADLSPIQKAKKEMSSLDKQSAKFKNTLKTLKVTAAVAAIKKLTNELLQCEQAFAEAEKATARIDFATQLNPTLNRTTKQLEDFASKTSKALRGAVSVDEINEQIAKLSFDKTGDQIEKIIDVATDLSAAMGTTLDDAVTQLSNTLAGNVGQLGKMFPELKNLSKESLQAGDAIDVISGKVKGMGEALSQTTSGSLSAYKNAMDDLKETLGRASTNFFTPIRDYITEIITNWNDATTALLNYKDAQKNIEGGVAGVEDYKLVWEKAQKELEDFEKSIIKTTNKNGITNYSRITARGEAVNISASDYWEQRKKYSDEVMRTGKEYEYAQLAAEAAARATASVVTGNTSSGASTGLTAVEDAIEEETELITSFYAHTIDDFEYQKTILSHIDTTFEDAMQNTVKNGLGDVGTLIEDIETGSLSLLVDFVGELMGAISSQSEVINNLLNFVSYFVNGISKPIAMFLEASLSPLIPSLNNLIKLITLIIKVISPIAEYIIGPIFKVISTIATAILVPIYNAVVAIHNFLKPRDKWSKLSLKEEVNGIWNGSSVGLGTDTRTSSYTAAKDVYVNINFANSFVNGDAREIALALRREIQLAERLGY